MIRIAIFASGSGTNAREIIKHLQHTNDIEVGIVVSNKTNAGVIDKAKNLGVEVLVETSKSKYGSAEFVELLQQKHQIDLIVLAGYLWLIPSNLVKAFPNRIVNIHPALLPNYGGKGMYGEHVHKAVIDNREVESGITIHYVNEKYDEGNIIFQKSISIDIGETPASLATKIHQLEHRYYPKVVEDLALSYLAKNE